MISILKSKLKHTRKGNISMNDLKGNCYPSGADIIVDEDIKHNN